MYPVVMARTLGTFMRLDGNTAVVGGFLILIVSCWLAWHHTVRLLRTPNPTNRNAIILVAVFSLLFLVNLAVGRISVGPFAGTASRYMTLIVPLYFGLYLQACLLSPKYRAVLILLTVLVHASAVLPHDGMERVSASYHRTKTAWRDAYLATGSIEAADKLAGGPLHPDAEATHLAMKLQVLEANDIPVPHVHGLCPDPRGIVMQRCRGRVNLATARDEACEKLYL